MSNSLKSVCFFFLICLVLPALSLRESETEVPECGLWDFLKYTFKCRSYYIFGEEKMSGVELCERAQDCYSSFNCKYVNKIKARVEEKCALINYAAPDKKWCLRGFFRKAYMAQFSNEEDSCFKKYTFLDSELNGVRSAFRHGKSCFMKYARDHCTTTAVNYFSPENYRRLTEDISSEEFSSECGSPHSYLQLLTCGALYDEQKSRAGKLDIIEFRSNRTFVEQSEKICRDTEACVLESCVSHKSEGLLEELAENCQAWENLSRTGKSKFVRKKRNLRTRK
ncbi:unnamed protein product [Caenorhabditis brenneri]